jgi:hypothetical protein
MSISMIYGNTDSIALGRAPRQTGRVTENCTDVR